MAKISQGVLGKFRGKVGSIVGSSWNGVDTIRAVSGPRTGAPTPAQLDQQIKFALVAKFLQSKKELLDKSFSSAAIKMTAPNSAASHALLNAVTGVSPNFSIDYSKVMLSKGGLFMPVGARAVAGAAGQINFSWGNYIIGNAKATDKAILVVYNEDFNVSLYTTTGATRGALADVMNVAPFTGKTVQTWLAFVNEDETAYSNSMFTGQIIVP